MNMIAILQVVAVLDGLAFAMMVTTLGPYIMSTLGGTNFFLGVMGSVGALISLLWNPIVGGLSDRNGRKSVLLQCMTICLIGNIITSLTNSLWILFLARMLTVLGSPIMSLVKSLVSDNIDSEDEQMAILNKLQAAGGVCFIIGPIVGGFLSEYEHGVKYIFYMISAMFIINICLVSLLEDRRIAKIDKQNPAPKSLSVTHELKAVVKNLSEIDWSRFWDLFSIKLMIDLTYGMFHFNWILVLAESYNLEGRYLGYVFAFISVIGIATSLIMIKLKNYLYPNDHLGLTRLQHGNLLLIITFICLGLVKNFTVYMLFLIPMAIGRTLIDTTMTESILSRAKPTEKGSIMGTFDTTISISGLISPLISGISSDYMGNSTAILLCAIPTLVNAGIINYKNLNRSKNE